MNGNLRTNTQVRRKFFDFADDEIFYPETDGEPMAETDKHRDLILELIETLKRYFSNKKDVYVTGNIMFYYLEDVPEEVVSPDVMVVFGVKRQQRRIYKMWEEKQSPSVIIEIASRSTFKKDRTEKRELYESLGVKEYFIFNPEYPKTLPSLIAYRLLNNEFQPLKVENGRVFSDVLDLELFDTGDWLKFFDIKQNKFLLNSMELIEEAEKRARKAEIENKKLKAKLAKLKNG
ncbi:MAG: Uma2 family endonuclease [Pyrinomonadaceae bacterium]